jgi:hypothetical protein
MRKNKTGLALEWRLGSKCRRIAISGGAILLGLTVISPVLAAEADYLSDLEAEAEISSQVISKQLTPEEKELLKLQDDLTDQLQSKRAASYRFYSKLSEEDKLDVLKIYKQSDKDLSKTANHVMELYFKK